MDNIKLEKCVDLLFKSMIKSNYGLSKEISSTIQDLDLIDYFKDVLDWTILSSRLDINFREDFLKRFSNYFIWEHFIPMDEEELIRYSDKKLNWTMITHKLYSENRLELIKKFSDKIDIDILTRNLVLFKESDLNFIEENPNLINWKYLNVSMVCLGITLDDPTTRENTKIVDFIVKHYDKPLNLILWSCSLLDLRIPDENDNIIADYLNRVILSRKNQTDNGISECRDLIFEPKIFSKLSEEAKELISLEDLALNNRLIHKLLNLLSLNILDKNKLDWEKFITIDTLKLISNCYIDHVNRLEYFKLLTSYSEMINWESFKLNIKTISKDNKLFGEELRKLIPSSNKEYSIINNIKKLWKNLVKNF